MFAYCNNEPVASTDPTGHYVGHRPIMVCDNGGPAHLIVAMRAAADKEQNIRNKTKSIKDKYSTTAWKELSMEERKAHLLTYESDIEAIMGVAPVNVLFTNLGEGTVGAYLHSERTIFISPVVLNDRDLALFTVRHELRHCYQNDLCDQYPDNKSEIYFRTIEIWYENRKEGSYILDGPEYSTQPLEDDADKWANWTG